MHTVEILEQALDALGQLGYVIRQEWFAGRGGGACEIRGRKLVFLDLDLTPADQLEQALGVLRMNPAVESLDLSPSLRAHLYVRKSA